jgi:hypothetical protein
VFSHKKRLLNANGERGGAVKRVNGVVELHFTLGRVRWR